MRYITVAVLGVALMLPNASQAGDFFGGGHGGWSCHGGSCHGGCWGGGHGGSWGGCHGGCWGGCQGGSWGGHGHAFGGSHGRGYAYYDGGYYYPYGRTMAYSQTPYYYGDAYVSNGYVRSSSYFEPGMVYADSKARVEVILPEPNTALTIQGQRMTTTGLRRVFVSPDLESGKTYIYNVSIPTGQAKGAGKVPEDIRKVEVQAGKFITVDFTRPVDQAPKVIPKK